MTFGPGSDDTRHPCVWSLNRHDVVLSEGARMRDVEVAIPVGLVELPGHLRVPDGAVGVVVFAHGSGSNRLSPRNRAVADALHEAGLATLLLDLLTPAEYDDQVNVFDVQLLERRLLAASHWLRTQPGMWSLPLGYFGASTGAAAAIAAAADAGNEVGAIVSRGGRPDLARDWLIDVEAPTLLIVGSHDPTVIDLNERAQREMTCECDVMVVPGAGHLFEEPGALEVVADAAREWFIRHLCRVSAPPPAPPGRGSETGSTRGRDL